MDQTYSLDRGSALYASLINAPNSVLFHEYHKPPLAHPADLLYQEMEDLAKLFVQVADAASQPDTFENEALGPTENLIRKVNEVYEQLQVIIKCFTGPDAASEGKTLYDFLRLRNPHVQQMFLSATKAHHEQIRLAANALKHRAARIAFIKIVNHNGVLVPGFYVRTTTAPEDQRGPDPEIHRLYRGTVHTALSFNHFLLGTAGKIYLFLHQLERALFRKRSPDRAPLPPLERILTRASRLHAEFYPDEYDRPTARIAATQTSISVRYPQLPRIRPGENPDRITAATVPLFVSGRPKSSMRSLLPYLQLTQPDKELHGLLPEPHRRPRP